jgi:hypothetical protein
MGIRMPPPERTKGHWGDVFVVWVFAVIAILILKCLLAAIYL